MRIQNTSLISFESINLDILLQLEKEGICGIDISPSQILNGDESFRQESISLLRDSGMQINSFQGLFFGLDTKLLEERSLNSRLDKLGEVSQLLNNKRFVVGSPNLRDSREKWYKTLTCLDRFARDWGMEILVENICGKLCSGEPFGSKALEEFGFSRVLDTSNALMCSSHCFQSWVTKYEYNYFHLAHRNHKPPLTIHDLSEILAIDDRLVSSKLVTWEFIPEDSDDFLNLIRKFKTLPEFSSGR
jgi:hypothetical protein